MCIRDSLPQIGNNYIINVKDTSVMFIIGFTEFFASHRYIVGINNKYFPSAVIAVSYTHLYAHEAATRLPSKLTATQLKGRFLDAEAAEQAPAEPQRRPWRTPQFLQDRPLTGREKGSATHLFMQFVRYEACTDEPGVRAELQRLQVQKFLTPRQAEAVDVQKLSLIHI